MANAADIPLRVEDAEAHVEGGSLSDEALEAVVETVASAVTPESEMHADRDYKEEVAGEYAKRSLETSYERAVATEI
jgi:carbon-monoxide dehydrogenase medium subunit